MKKFKFNDLYLLKFVIYGSISAYDYSINSKFTIAWLLLAILMIVFWLHGELKISE